MKNIKVTLVMKINDWSSGDFVLDYVRDLLELDEDVLGFQVNEVQSLEDVKELLFE